MIMNNNPNLGASPGGTGDSGGFSKALPWLKFGFDVLSSTGSGMGAAQQQKLTKRQLDLQQDQQRFGQQASTIDMQRQLDNDAYQRANTNMRAPGASMVANALAQRLGLGQIIAPPQGQAGFTPAPNVPVQQARNPLMDQRNKDVQWALEAVNKVRPDGSRAYKESERNYAQKEILDRYGVPNNGWATGKPFVPQNYMNLGQG